MAKLYKKFQNCILCNNSKGVLVSSKVRDSKKFKIIKCSNCGHYQLFPMPITKENKKFYDLDKQIKNIEYRFNLPRLEIKSNYDTKRRVNFVKEFISKKGKILEIGSGYGFFIKDMEKKGFDIMGVEISKQRRNVLRKITGVKILNINFEQENISIDSKFDLIVMFQVLEHILNPIKFIKNVLKLLKPGGRLLVEVPNVDDFQIKKNESYRNWYWQRAHIHYFSPKNLKFVLKKGGLKEVKINGVQRYSIENMFNWKLLNKPQPKNPSFELDNNLSWIDKHYKNYLEKKIICDTLVAIGIKNDRIDLHT